MGASVIRQATESDIETLAHLISESFRDVAERFSLTPDNCPRHPSNYTGNWVQADLKRGVQYFLLESDGRAVGCVGLESPSAEVRYLERLAVLPEFRRRGLGNALTTHAIEEARVRQANVISIGIIADQVELKDWYARLGFAERESKRFPHLPFRVTFMELRLVKDAAKAANPTRGYPPHSSD